LPPGADGFLDGFFRRSRRLSIRMFDNLQDKMDRVFKTLRGEAALNEWHIDNALKEIRVALLEADVHFKVVKEFTNRVRERAVGQDVLTAFSPAQQVTKVVRDELQELLGGNEVGLALVGSPAVVMMVGLQGSGKTTTSGKLALHLRNRGRRPLLVPCDVYRPAAIEQLRIVAKGVNVPFFEIGDDRDPQSIARRAVTDARTLLYDTVILDTAGRLHIDAELMAELDTIKRDTRPSEILFVADAMTGQDAVKSAKEFDDRLGVTGIVLTKLDGDARGGAALSIKSVVNRPIKLVGVGEKYADLDVFYPDRMASRILGMGDVLSLIEKVETEIDRKEAERLAQRVAKDKFTLEDLRAQLQQVKKMGPLSSLVNMLPGAGKISEEDIDEKAIVRMEAILDSMTKKEREFPQVIDGKRKKRIAKGSGTSVQQINQLLKQYLQMKKMMRSFSKGFGARKFGKMMKGMPPGLMG
jgi:signal recognition particle subunit SRP54